MCVIVVLTILIIVCSAAPLIRVYQRMRAPHTPPRKRAIRLKHASDAAAARSADPHAYQRVDPHVDPHIYQHVDPPVDPPAGTFAIEKVSGLLITTTRLDRFGSVDTILTVTPDGHIIFRHSSGIHICDPGGFGVRPYACLDSLNPGDYEGNLLVTKDRKNYDCVDHLGKVLHSFNTTDLLKVAAAIHGDSTEDISRGVTYIDGAYAYAVGWDTSSFIYNYRTGELLCYLQDNNMPIKGPDYTLRVGRYFVFGYECYSYFVICLIDMTGRCVLKQNFNSPKGDSSKLFATRDKLILFTTQANGSIDAIKITLAGE